MTEETQELKIKRGMRIKLKRDIQESLMRFGHNREKESFAGTIREVSQTARGGKLIYLKRDAGANRRYRYGKKSWKFWYTDVESIVDIDKLEEFKKQSHVFNPEQLITC